MSILSLIILVLFLFWLASVAISGWESINTNYPLSHSPVAHISLKTLLLVFFLPVFISLGIFFLMGLSFRK
ncbi:hypothetical protein OAE48_02830 [Flavobacteriales bacterium]|nr:hypothetical protein [Flavobacteriales bacterium]